jgi:phytoene desaturase
MGKKVVIVGSGISSLALAVRLKSKNYDVHVYEKNSTYGGKLEEFKLGEFRYDFGPKLFTMPQYLLDLFRISNKNIEDYFSYKKLNISCKYFWKDGKELNAYVDRERLIKEFVSKFRVNEKNLRNYLSNSKKKFLITKSIFLDNSLHKFSTYFSLDTIKGILNIFKLNLFTSLNSLNQKTFTDVKVVQFFNRFATYNGSNPYKTSGIMSMIQHLEHDIGTYMPVNGMNEIPSSIYKLAKDLGVKFYFNSQVDKIIIKNKFAVGIEVSSKKIDYDIVVSNMDVNYTYERLLVGIKKPKYLENYEPSSSALVFYWNMNKSFDELKLHNVIFSDNYFEEFDYIFNKKLIYEDPTIYISITSKIVKSDAPNDCENWFILINAPHDSGQNWEEISKKLKIDIINKLNKILKVDISKHIEMERILSPKDIEIKTLSKFGSLYGSSSNSMSSAFLRHPNFSNQIKNLFFCGGSVHPGGGIPLCLKSAEIVSKII